MHHVQKCSCSGRARPAYLRACPSSSPQLPFHPRGSPPSFFGSRISKERSDPRPWCSTSTFGGCFAPLHYRLPSTPSAGAGPPRLRTLPGRAMRRCSLLMRRPHWRLTWKSWAPLRIKLFHWLAMQGRCWTTDRLARRGLPHEPTCALCDQEPEIMQHLLAYGLA